MATLFPPAGFLEQHTDNVVWWIKAEWASLLQQRVITGIRGVASLDSEHRTPNFPPSGGRGPIDRIEVNSQAAIMVRRYRRGGLVRHILRDLYWDRPPRPFVELCRTEEIRGRGIATIEVIGAGVEWTPIGFYRGILMTLEATGFHNLWEWLQHEHPTELRQHTLTAVARAIAQMHRAGIVHADLNPTNILVNATGTVPQVLTIDFDRARLFSGPVPPSLCDANLRRFQRFFAKYDVLNECLTPTEFEHFRRVYEATCVLKK